ncbi:hypothetical protein [Vibrio harveyi]|uniref:hypothetical protein n=1 Tax=Vibrio harveyi TaxID=669 RepID=UPI002380615D|nr:hypothetical protein [Vibrio harveyi]
MNKNLHAIAIKLANTDEIQEYAQQCHDGISPTIGMLMTLSSRINELSELTPEQEMIERCKIQYLMTMAVNVDRAFLEAINENRFYEEHGVMVLDAKVRGEDE